MPYQPNIPRPTDQLNNSQVDIQGNFQEIFNWVAINHEQFDTVNVGKHKQVTLPVNVAPTPTGLNELNLWSQVSVNTNALELTWQRSAAGIITEMTAGRVEPASPRNGWARMPAGILLKWGFENSTGTGFVVNYPLNINGVVAPIFSTTPFAIIATPFAGIAAGITVTLNSAASFTVNTFQTNLAVPVAASFFYLAIGV